MILIKILIGMDPDHQIIHNKLGELVGHQNVFYDKNILMICFYPMLNPLTFPPVHLHSTITDILDMGQSLINMLPKEYKNELVKLPTMDLFYFRINKNDKDVAIVKICY